MIAVAENMASTPIVRDRYGDPFAGKVLAPEVDRAVASLRPGWLPWSSWPGRSRRW
jgi:hypothetical protein